MHIKGQRRHQATLFPERLNELIGAENPVRVIDAFVAALDLIVLGFAKAQSQATSRPPYEKDGDVAWSGECWTAGRILQAHSAH